MYRILFIVYKVAKQTELMKTMFNSRVFPDMEVYIMVKQ